MKKYFIFLVSSLILMACNRNYLTDLETVKKAIVGEWACSRHVSYDPSITEGNISLEENFTQCIDGNGYCYAGVGWERGLRSAYEILKLDNNYAIRVYSVPYEVGDTTYMDLVIETLTKQHLVVNHLDRAERFYFTRASLFCKTNIPPSESVCYPPYGKP